MANTFHVALNVKSIPEAIERYRKILGAEPAKVRPDYAKFELADPPLILSLNRNGAPGTVGHLGIRYPEASTVTAALRRAKDEALEPYREEGVICCYAKADKYWVRDADGMPWEMYTLLEDADVHYRAPETASAPEPVKAEAPAAACGCAS